MVLSCNIFHTCKYFKYSWRYDSSLCKCNSNHLPVSKEKKNIYKYIYIYSRLHGLPEGLIMHDIIIIRDKLVLSFKLLRQLLSPECKKTS